MKFTILQQDLLPHLQAASRSVGVRSSLPVLDNILLSCDGKKLKIAATNLEVGVVKYINVDNSEAGEITVPAKTLVELVSGLGADKITVQSEGEILTVSAGKLKASINGIAASEFPAIPLAEGGVVFPKEALLSSAQVLFASAVDEGRPVLTGILTEVSGGKLDFVATDGFRLAHREFALPKSDPGGSKGFKSLIPGRTFEEVLRLLSEENIAEVKIALSENHNQAVFSLGNTVVSSRLIEGQFPAWQKIIPEKFTAQAVIEKEDLLKAIKLAAIFAKNEANIVVLSLKKGLLQLESHAKEVGSQENEVEGEVEGEELKIAFNTKFILDAVSNTPGKKIQIRFSGALSAAVVKPVGEEGLEYIIMPVRLS